MKSRMWTVVCLVLGLAAPAYPTAQQIGAGDTALLFGGIDAEGGIGDWYVSNGVVEAIIDNVGPAPDLVGVLPPAQVPPIQSLIAFTGGSLMDLGRVGTNSDQLAQMFTVGGLSTSNFLLYSGLSAPNANTIRATGSILFPPTSVQPSPCLAVVTDYIAAGTDPFLTISSTATNNCGVVLSFGGMLDVFLWGAERANVPFSGGGTPTLGGRGFNHPVLNLSNPAGSLELMAFTGAPGTLRPDDGIVDTSDGSTCDEVAYGILGVEVEVDQDGPGGAASVVTPSNTLFGVSSTLVTALGNAPLGSLNPGGTLRYTRRVYVGSRNDVRSVANDMITELSTRTPTFSTGTISGNVDAADTANVEASIVITRVGQCQGNTSLSCRVNADCGGSGPCVDPVPTVGQGVGAAMSHVRTDAAGAFSGVVLPRGRYELNVASAERDTVVVASVTVGAGNTAVAVPPLSARGTVAFTVREKRAGLPLLPAKLTFKGVAPTADPLFKRDLAATLGANDIHAETFGGTQAGTTGHAAGQGNVVYTASGTGDIQIRPGTYDIYASRGSEYTVQLVRVTVPAGGVAGADFRLKRAVKTKNAVSADFHIHSGRSFDTNAAIRDRVAAFAAEGVEVMISTDHEKHVDFGPFISDFGIGALMTSIIGNEVTGSVPNPPSLPDSFGHINAWPVPLVPTAKRDGAIEDEFVAPNWVYKRLRDQGAEVIQYNHVRAGVAGITSIGFFNNIGCNRCANSIDTPCVQDTDCPGGPGQDCTCVGYQPDRPITQAPNDILLDDGIRGPGTTANTDGLNNLDFDVMEIANAARNTDFDDLRLVRRDWFSLLNQGIFRPGTGVSDSHRITIEHSGWARTYVFGAGDDPAAINPTTFDDNVVAGNMVISAGPFIEFSMRAVSGGDSAGLGELLSAPGGQVRLKIKVRAPAWIPIEEVRVIGNGFEAVAFDESTRPRVKNPPEQDFQRSGGTSRFRTTFRTTVSQDTYFVVEAGVKIPADINTLPTPPPIVDIVVPGVVPIAITNPIFVDVNGNNVFDPPGLPVMTARATQATPPAFARVEIEDVAPAPRLWERLRSGMTRVARRLSGEAVAQGRPGSMTGVTKEKKAEAAAKGEYFPLHEFSIPADGAAQVLEQERAAREAQQRAREAAEGQ